MRRTPGDFAEIMPHLVDAPKALAAAFGDPDHEDTLADAIAAYGQDCVRRVAEAASPAAGWTAVPTHALDWLHGRGPDDNGIWFGDHAPSLERGRFWWRTVFDRLCAVAPPTTERDSDAT